MVITTCCLYISTSKANAEHHVFYSFITFTGAARVQSLYWRCTSASSASAALQAPVQRRCSAGAAPVQRQGAKKGQKIAFLVQLALRWRCAGAVPALYWRQYGEPPALDPPRAHSA